ncbi:MAG: hypothetical protein LH609_18865 [Rudanella sp.]|nr:hypothetical protein [Rudanella sp.]
MNLKTLPQHDPAPNLWNRIEADLNTDTLIDSQLKGLPMREPVADLWDRIDSDLSETKIIPIGRGNTRQLSVTRWMTVAAAVVLVVGDWWLWPDNQAQTDERVTVSYSVETGPKLPAEPSGSVADSRAEAFIARQCAEQQLSCQKPEIHELRNQLVELKQEQQRIGQEMALFGTDPALVRAQVKVENQRAEVTREIITLLRS